MFRISCSSSKKRNILSAILIFTGSFSFAENSFIDTPILDIIDYFAKMSGYFMTVAFDLGKILALVGFVWSCILLVMRRKQAGDIITGTLMKWLMFFLIMSLYPGFCVGLRKISTQIGLTASGSSKGYPVINRALTGYINDIKTFLSNPNAEEVLQKMQMKQDSLYKQRREGVETVYNNNYVGTELRSKDDELMALTNSEKSAQRKIDNKKKKQDAAAEKRILKTMSKIEAMKDFLIVDGQSVTERYKADISLKTASGKDTGYISPSSVLKVVLLIAQISWEREFWIETLNLEAADNIGGKIKKITEIAGFNGFYNVRKLFSIILLGLTILFMIVISCAVLIQYVMGIIEYVIVSSVAVILIPMMLFDGTKDMSNKILPSLFSQAMKLIFVVLCMVWVIISFLQIGSNLLRDTSSFGFVHFAYIVFQLILIFAISANAPKLAQTLLTGQPQMSMGEFMTAAGGMLATAKVAEKTATVGARAGAVAATAGISAAGSAGRAFVQGKNAYKTAISNGESKLQSTFSGLKAAEGSVAHDAASGASNVMNNLVQGRDYSISSFVRGNNLPTPSNVSYTGSHDQHTETPAEYLRRNFQ